MLYKVESFLTCLHLLPPPFPASPLWNSLQCDWPPTILTAFTRFDSDSRQTRPWPLLPHPFFFFFHLWHFKLLIFFSEKFSSLGFEPLVCFRLSSGLSGNTFALLCFPHFFSSCYHIDHGLLLSPLLCRLCLHKHMKSMLSLLMKLPKTKSPA